jgi:hypothetical protein
MVCVIVATIRTKPKRISTVFATSSVRKPNDFVHNNNYVHGFRGARHGLNIGGHIRPRNAWNSLKPSRGERTKETLLDLCVMSRVRVNRPESRRIDSIQVKAAKRNDFDSEISV